MTLLYQHPPIASFGKTCVPLGFELVVGEQWRAVSASEYRCR
jgi:hypothetical protein